MFSKEDYVKYFRQVRAVELQMHDRFGSYAEAVSDTELKKFFRSMQRQEKAHSRIVDDILKAFGHTEK